MSTRVAITFIEGEELHIPFARAFTVLVDLLRDGFKIGAVRIYIPGVLPDPGPTPVAIEAEKPAPKYRAASWMASSSTNMDD